MKKIFLLVVLCAIFLSIGCNRRTPVVVTKPPTPPPVETPAGDAFPPGWKTYSDESRGFSISHSPRFEAYADYAQVVAQAYIPFCDGDMKICFVYPRTVLPDTNFEGAGISIKILTSATPEACAIFEPHLEPQPTVNINGIAFSAAYGGTGAAGHAQRIRNYHAWKNSLCYEISARVSSTNPGVYEPGAIKAFDEAAVWKELEQSIQTFRFF